jgi:hypothetical protein
MRISSVLPLSLLLLVDTQRAAADGLFSNSLWKAHKTTQRRTRSLGKDLRTAFGSILVQQNPLDSSENTVIYCKSGSSLNGGGQSGNGDDGADDSGGRGGSEGDGNGPSTTRAPGTATATSSSPSATASSIGTPWKLMDTHVGYTTILLLYAIAVLTSRFDCVLLARFIFL